MTKPPKKLVWMRYCANLGHRQDDESGMVYMRSRYYAPTTGRFISEDPGMSGANWFTYCGNDPVKAYDMQGKWYVDGRDLTQNAWVRAGTAGIYLCVLTAAAAKNWEGRMACLMLGAACAGMALGACNLTATDNAILYSPTLFSAIAGVAGMMEVTNKNQCLKVAGALMAVQSLALIAACAWAFHETNETDPRP